VVMILVGYNPPTSYMGGDKAYWRHSASGQFSVKSAYQSRKRVEIFNKNMTLCETSSGIGRNESLPLDNRSSCYYDKWG
jgi:hypothetical protein